MKNINGWNKSLFQEISSDRTSESKASVKRKLERIRRKLMAGGRLTAEEKAFLRRYAPALYEQAMAMERERAAYEERLKKCHTKEEADRVKMENMAKTGTAENQDAETKIMAMAQMKAAEEDAAAAVNKKPSRREEEKKDRKAEQERADAGKFRHRKKAARERAVKKLAQEEYKKTERSKEEQETGNPGKETGIIYGRPVNSTAGRVGPLPKGVYEQVVVKADKVYGGGEFARGLAAYQAVLQEGNE